SSIHRDERESRENAITSLDRELEAVQKAKPGAVAWVTDLMPDPPRVHVLERGDFHHPGAIAPPRGLSAIDENPRDLVMANPPAKSSGRRLAFARWLTAEDNRASSLLARVTVNRVWQRHFGRGIVSTLDNFGLAGAHPTH